MQSDKEERECLDGDNYIMRTFTGLNVYDDDVRINMTVILKQTHQLLAYVDDVNLLGDKDTLKENGNFN